MGLNLVGHKPGQGRRIAVAGGPAAVAGHKRVDLPAGGHHTGGPAAVAAGHTPAAVVVAAGTQVRGDPASQQPLQTFSLAAIDTVPNGAQSLHNNRPHDTSEEDL